MNGTRALAREGDRLEPRGRRLVRRAECGPPRRESRSAVVSSIIPIDAATGRSRRGPRVSTPGFRCGSSQVSSSTARAARARYSSVVSHPSAASSSRAALVAKLGLVAEREERLAAPAAAPARRPRAPLLAT